MREDLANQMAPGQGEPIDPVAMARRDLQKVLPRRFYKEAQAQEAEGQFALVLDGKNAHTPGRQPIRTPSLELMQALAGEWSAQGEFIDPGSMPLTRIVNSALDGVSREMGEVRAEIVKYAGSDLLCYRAGDPQSLVEAQSRMWDPILAWAREAFGARFICAEGVIFAKQPEPAVAAVAQVVEGVDSPLALAALSVMTTITGSALLALAVAQGHLSAEEAWATAHVDEDFQIAGWGEDSDSAARRARRWLDMEAAAKVYALSA